MCACACVCACACACACACECVCECVCEVGHGCTTCRCVDVMVTALEKTNPSVESSDVEILVPSCCALFTLHNGKLRIVIAYTVLKLLYICDWICENRPLCCSGICSVRA